MKIGADIHGPQRMKDPKDIVDPLTFSPFNKGNQQIKVLNSFP